jgi:tripartite ATP-independent transporter DctM subunit
MDSLIDALPFLMAATLAVFLFAGYPVALTIAAVGFLFFAVGYALDLMPLIALFNLPLRMYSNLGENLIYPAVPMLLFMGIALERSGVARELLTCLDLMLRRVPGSLAIAVLIIGIVLAPSAGLIGASVATLALIALPSMLAQGYRTSFASGSVAAAGTLGLIFPPGLMLFFLAEHLDVRLGPMFLATVIPGLVLTILYVAYLLARTLADPSVAPRSVKPNDISTLQFAIYVVRSLALPLLLVLLVLGSIIAGIATPTQSSSVGAAGALLLMALNRSLSFRLFYEVAMATAMMTAMVFLIVMAATVFSYVFIYLGGGDAVTDALHGLGFGRWGILLFVLGLLFLMGFFIDWIEITVIVLPIIAPTLSALDFSDYLGSSELSMLWIAVLVALNLQASFLTPPFGFALFFLKGAAPPGVRLEAIYRGVSPFVALQVLGVALVLIFPLLATWLPVYAFGTP